MKNEFEFKVVDHVESIDAPKIKGLGIIIAGEAVGWLYYFAVAMSMT